MRTSRPRCTRTDRVRRRARAHARAASAPLADRDHDHDEDHVIGDAASDYSIEVSDDQIIAILPV